MIESSTKPHVPKVPSPRGRTCNEVTGDSIPSIGPTDPFDTLPLAMPKHVETWFNFCELSLAFFAELPTSEDVTLAYPSTDVKVQGPGLIPLEANELSNPMLTLLLPLALSDPAVMHALLCVSGIQYTAIRARSNTELVKAEGMGTKHTPLYLLHKRHALVAIQKRLNDPELAVSDGTIAAIALLAGYEVRSFPDLHLHNPS